MQLSKPPNRVYLLRHANSNFNYAWAQTLSLIEQGTHTNEALTNLSFDTALLDCPLSELGRAQCMKAQTEARQLKEVKTVFVSPLRRALQTAYLVFKDHPNFKNIKFIMHPDLREVAHTVCDVPDSYSTII